MTKSMVTESLLVIHVLWYQDGSSFSAFQLDHGSREVQTALLLALYGDRVTVCQGALVAWLAYSLHVTSDANMSRCLMSTTRTFEASERSHACTPRECSSFPTTVRPAWKHACQYPKTLDDTNALSCERPSLHLDTPCKAKH